MSTDLHPHAHAAGHSHAAGHANGRGHDLAHRSLLPTEAQHKPTRSVLAWPAWLRVAAVLPLVLLLWLAVWWANEGANLW